MSFGFRKSKQFGPFRVSLSKSGVSASLGAHGARITAGARGTYVTFSKAGFYYRTRLNPSNSAPSLGEAVTKDVKVEASEAIDVPVVSTSAPPSSTESFGDVTPDDFLRDLNQRIARRNYATPVAAGVSAALLAFSLLEATGWVSAAFPPIWPSVAIVGFLASIFLEIRHRRSRSCTLHYENCEETKKRMTALHKAVSALWSGAETWSVGEVVAKTEIAPRQAVLNRIKIVSDALPLPYILTNVTPAALRLTDGTLYFLPDRLFIWHAGHFTTVDYASLKIRIERMRFLERGMQPSDATRAGGMRRSLTDDGTIPILWYGIIDLDAAPALQARLMTSRVENAQEFVGELRNILGGDDSSAPPNAAAAILYTQFDSTSTPLFYDLPAQDIRRAQAIREAFAQVLQSEYVWLYENQVQTQDWKRNAGAATLVVRTRVSPVLLDRMPGFETNAAIGLDVGGSTVYVLPDQCIVRTGGTYMPIGRALSVQTKSCSFREEDAVPPDSVKVGQTWRYVNKHGGPDLRFNDNRQIPILRYGEILLSSEGPWRLHLCLSRSESAERFEAMLRAASENPPSESPRDAPRSESPRDAPPSEHNKRPADITGALHVLGLKANASFQEASVAYRNLARQNHPDKVAHLAPEFRELAERRMRELNAAFGQVPFFFEPR